ncbi:MAG: filamentous hemagglutinin N-terminal domain-containing protein [Phormidesmis sp. RL_2_1]|nr:filamentous hemagglutinin N-terminal domain-containing protein [Phormidesmis sp. RL_2_1]
MTDTQSGVDLVIGRVTGGNASLINGQLALTGGNNPDLFLVNPNGITFGSGASLSLPGSFVASTAESVLFNNGLEFSAGNPGAAPLLNVSSPTGLQMGQTPSDITVQGNGHRLTAFDPVFAPYTQSMPSSILNVSSGNSLAFIGGNLSLDGGVLSAQSGRLELAAIAQDSGTSQISFGTHSWAINPIELVQLGDISLTQAALLDASQTGTIQIQGRDIDFIGGSLAFIQNVTAANAGDIIVRSAGHLQLSGMSPNGQIRSGLDQQMLGAGNGGNLQVSAANITMTGGAGILSRSFGSGTTGDIKVQASGHIQALGFAEGTNANSSIGNLVFSSGASGDIHITAFDLSLLNAGTATTSSILGTGPGGNLIVNVANTTSIGGENPLTQSLSAIGAISFGVGDSGTVNLNTRRLALHNAGRVTTGGFATGNAGSVVVNATESIDISDNRSAIESSIGILPAATRAAFGLPDSPSGNAGNVTVNTPLLRVNNQGQVSVKNEGNGDAGNLTIIADRIFLDQQGAITASTASGAGGNIKLTLTDLLLLRNASFINTESTGTGNGGNITIHAPIIAGFENSDIVANAVSGDGGNIAITTQGIFGLEFRNQLTPENDITASSRFGVNGTVEINDFGLDPDSGLVDLSDGLADNSNQVAQGCSASGGNEFIATGRGGIPVTPTEWMNPNTPWADTRDLSAFFSNPLPPSLLPLPPEQGDLSTTLIEINTWRTNANGQVELLAVNSTSPNLSAYATCAELALTSTHNDQHLQQ